MLKTFTSFLRSLIYEYFFTAVIHFTTSRKIMIDYLINYGQIKQQFYIQME